MAPTPGTERDTVLASIEAAGMGVWAIDTGDANRLFREKAKLGRREAFLDKPCSAAALRQAVSLSITGSITRTAARL